jgi:hypothetical protein
MQHKKKLWLLIMFGLVLVGSMIIGGASVALFTSTSENQGNHFLAGTLSIQLDRENNVHYFDINNIAPGDRGSEEVIISNTGSLPLQYNITTNLIGSLASGTHPLRVFVVDLNGTPISSNQQQRLNHGENDVVVVHWEMPLEAGNEYQDGSATLAIIINAEQIVNGSTPIAEPMPGENLQCHASDNFQICASVSNASPEQYSRVTVYGRLWIDGELQTGQTMDSVWHYKSTSSACTDAFINDEGIAACEKYISRASIGYTVEINVTIDDHLVTTSFTPVSRNP